MLCWKPLFSKLHPQTWIPKSLWVCAHYNGTPLSAPSVFVLLLRKSQSVSQFRRSLRKRQLCPCKILVLRIFGMYPSGTVSLCSDQSPSPCEWKIKDAIIRQYMNYFLPLFEWSCNKENPCLRIGSWNENCPDIKDIILIFPQLCGFRKWLSIFGNHKCFEHLIFSGETTIWSDYQYNNKHVLIYWNNA